MAQILLVIARRQPERYRRLRQIFAEQNGIEVVLDRRVGERRQGDDPSPFERRRGERRQKDIGHDLDRLGWSIVHRSP